MVTLDIRNPDDLINTYGYIQIQRSLTNSAGGMSDVVAAHPIDTATATDLSTGYTSYSDAAGEEGTHYYRFRYRNAAGTVVSSWSEIYLAGTTIFHNRFRRKMRDINSERYYFENTDITNMLQNAINKLFPATYMESIDETLTTLTNTRKYSFPYGVFRVTDIEFLDSQGDVVGQAQGWSLRARQIVFNTVPQTGLVMRLYVEKPFRKLAEVPETMDDLILDLMQLEAYETFEADRTQYYKYTTVTNPEGGNLPSIARIIERLRATTEGRLNSQRRVRRAVTYTP